MFFIEKRIKRANIELNHSFCVFNHRFIANISYLWSLISLEENDFPRLFSFFISTHT